MRLLELVRCGRPTVVEDSPDSPSSFTSSYEPEKMRRERPRARGAADSTWRPSLGAISEDGVNLTPSAAKTTSNMAKIAKNPEKGRSRRAATARRRETDSSRHYEATAMFPVFPPAIFML